MPKKPPARKPPTALMPKKTNHHLKINLLFTRNLEYLTRAIGLRYGATKEVNQF